MDETNRVAPTAKTPELIIEPDKDGMAKAVSSLRRGELVGFPTETVYGLGVDARNDKAVAAIFAAKGRPAVNPLIVHVKDLATARLYGEFNALALQLAQEFWPGPLTLVVPLREGVALSSRITAGLNTIALRVPAGKVALSLLKDFDGPIAAPSANPSGMLSPTEAEHVEEGLGEHVALILDGGPCQLGLESTILAQRGGRAALLRAGAVPAEKIATLLGGDEQLIIHPESQADAERPVSPGRLPSHYAPNARLRVDAHEVQDGEMMLAFGPDAPKGLVGLNLSPTGDLQEAATNLYAYLHILDDTGIKSIAVMPIPHEGLGAAINDRLKRAAAPRQK